MNLRQTGLNLIQRHEENIDKAFSILFSSQVFSYLNESDVTSFSKYMMMGYLLIDQLPRSEIKKHVTNFRDYSFISTFFVDHIPTKILKEILTKNPLSNFWYFWLFGTKDGRKQVMKLMKKPYLLIFFLTGIALTLVRTKGGIDNKILNSLLEIFGLLNFKVDVLCDLAKPIGHLLKFYATNEKVQRFLKQEYNNIKSLDTLARNSACVILGGRKRKLYKGSRGGKYYIKNKKKIYVKD